MDTQSQMSLTDLFLNTHLYSSVPRERLGALAEDLFDGVRRPAETLDTFCNQCSQASTFTGHYVQVTSHIPHVHQLSQFYTESIQINVILVEYRCTRNKEHRMYFAFLPREDHIIKFGQYPSIADLSVHEIEPYRTVLSEEQFREFKRAIQLASHDIGVGSFVYLRRIIENLIEEAHVKATKSDPEWDEVDYQGKRVLERIKVLEDYLPDSLVKNRQSYAILSKGIHELSEADCRRFFNTVRLAIELILDEKLAEKRRNQKIAQVRKGLDAITNEIRSSD